MKWYSGIECNGIILSTRVRLARNVRGYPFASKLSPEQKSAMIADVNDTFEKFGLERYNYIDIGTKSSHDKKILVEEHIISSEFAEMPPSEKGLLITDESGNVSVMVGEEDHIRIQVIQAGGEIKEAYSCAEKIDDMLSKGLEFSFDKKLGYLTCCPSNTGTGMRISCMLHLPMLSRNNYIKSVFEYCSRLGLTVRGFYGEGSKAEGEIYQISNQITLGISEEETIKRLEEAVKIIASKEQNLRDQLKNAPEIVNDKLWRSYGILSYARSVSSGEFLNLWSDCMLAKDCGIIPELQKINMIRLLIGCMPAHVADGISNGQDASERDIYRAQIIRLELQKNGKDEIY